MNVAYFVVQQTMYFAIPLLIVAIGGGESAALLFTAGVGTVVANNIFSAFTRSGGTSSSGFDV